MSALRRSFYDRDTLAVARDLLGCRLVHETPRGHAVGRIVEVEAYGGSDDPASHAARGPTPRNAPMFAPAGTVYVYFTYGMHWCANVVCDREGVCEAVLLRAGEPVEGRDMMRGRRPGIADDRLLAAGPARLTLAMGIGKPHDGASLLRGGSMWCAEDEATERHRARAVWTRRVGLAAGRGDDLEWRRVIPGHPHASRRR